MLCDKSQKRNEALARRVASAAEHPARLTKAEVELLRHFMRLDGHAFMDGAVATGRFRTYPRLWASIQRKFGDRV